MNNKRTATSAIAAALLGLVAVTTVWMFGPNLTVLLAMVAAAPVTLVVFWCAGRSQAGASGGRNGCLDSGTGLPGAPALAELGDALLDRCQRRDEPLTMLVFDFNDLPEVEALYGNDARRKMLVIIGQGLRELAGRNGLALRTTKRRFIVLLPGCDRAAALDRLSAKLGAPCSFEMHSPDDLLLVPEVSALCATAETDSLEQLLRGAMAQPRRAVPDGSTAQVTDAPSCASGVPFDLPDRERVYPPQGSTFPMPLRVQ